MPALLPLAALSLGAAVFALVRALGTRRQLHASLERAAGLGVPVPAPAAVSRRKSFPFAAQLARVALAVRPRMNRDALALRLAGAGLSRRITPDGYLAVQGGLLAGGILFSLLVGAAASPAQGFLFALTALGAAVIVPDRVVAGRALRRRERVLWELPGALDLLAITVQAGLGFDAALARVAQVSEGPLAEEFTTMLTELRVGEARQTALQRLADRVGVPELAAFARAVARADQLGMPLAQTLMAQAADARARRQSTAEEKAAKAPVKMLFPTVVFIFPALFIVVLGPTILSMSKVL
jgi:tight adherence protein C